MSPKSSPMTIHEASRTLLKSPPELWAECSDATSLNRHLDQFGEIRITRLEPETAVAWEGENASGTVRLEPSGWGTRVILTAEEVDPVIDQSSPPVAVVEESEPPVVEARPEPEPAIVVVVPEAPVVEAQPEQPAVAAEPTQPAMAAESAPRGGFFARLMARMRGPVPVVEEPALEPVVDPEPEPLPEPAAETPAAEAPAVEAPVVEVAGESKLHEVSEPMPEPASPAATAALDALTGALDSLGMAHHRPFSRS